MQRFIIIILILFISGPIFAQSIGYRDESENILIVGTNYMTTNPLSNRITGIALEVLTNKTTGENTVNISLLFETLSKTFCQKNSKAIFKTFEGNVITLQESLETNSITRETRDSKYILKPQYSISEEDLQTIMKEGIQLMRIETLKGLKDFKYKKDVLGGFLTAEYNLILEKKDFSSDF